MNSILVLVALCLLSTAYAFPANSKIEKKPFTIEEAALNAFSISSFTGEWISDEEFQYQDKNTKDVKVLNVAKNKIDVILSGKILDKYKASKYKISPSRKFVLIAYNESTVFRHARTAQYAIYSMDKGNFYDLAKKAILQEAEWGPRGNSILFIKDNDIYLVKNVTSEMNSIRVTTSGIPGVVYNGISDWVYEEEVLSSSKAFWFSPNGDRLLYLTFNDTGVSKSTITKYGEPKSIQDQYPKQEEIRYPKSGSTPPGYELWHVTLNNVAKRTLITGSSVDIMHNVNWGDNENFLYLKSNRVQNESKTFLCNLNNSPMCQLKFRHDNKYGWANTELPLTSKSLDRFLRLEGIPVEKYGNFMHLVMHHETGSSVPLTRGRFDVIRILRWDEKNKTIYYSAPEEKDSTTVQIYSVSEVGGSKPQCLSCQILSPEGRFCKDATASFSKMSTYVLINCNGPDPKIVYMFKNRQPFRNPLQVMEDNSQLRKKLETKLFPEVVNLTVTVPGPFEADVRLFFPPNADKTGKTKYPLLIYVYGGPGSKAIGSAFKFDWGLYVSTNLRVIYGFIDGRNTLRKGENMLFAGYRALGTYEMIDQINITRYIQAKFPMVDAERTGIWGWSYGGYAATKILEMDSRNTFKCGIAVAPVADWLYYDSIYTERYMGLPEDNKNGYENSSTLNDVANLRKKKYFLIHGNADDNVHYQNAMMLAKSLERKNVPFELMSYPDENHSLTNVRNHLYHAMDDFWKRCFQIVPGKPIENKATSLSGRNGFWL